ncbi:unnamed protein product [Prorocentrum cordatum]|uniref:Uncharacterized protein n=1 Tax=Prorocentrum cordatum TaxID=2364126 RepID=A0ABN9TSV6_9DINO|nr:unnamed protein product [Polarella glacialis]
MPCSQGGEASAAGDPPGAAAMAATDALEPGGAGPGVDLLITEEGWGLSSANWLVRRSAWSIGFLERAFRLCHEEMPLFGDQDAMIHLLLNEGALASAGGDALHPRAAVIPQREINAYDALNAFYMEADAYEEGDLLVTFPGCKEASACNPLFRLAAERAERRAHGEPEPPPEEQQSWAHTRLFGPPQAAAEVYELARQAQRVA